MSIVDEILRDIPADQLAEQLGTDPQTAEAAARNAIPALLAGMQNNAGDPQGEQALAGALNDHSSSLLANDGPIDLADVDTADGQKIVRHIFGSNEPDVVSTLAGHQGLSGSQGGLVRRLLPILAPIVLAYLARRLTGGQGAGGGLLGQILGGVLGGGMGGGMGMPQQQGGMGGMFPGGNQGGFPQQGGGGLSDVLGGLLGGIFGGGNSDIQASGSAHGTAGEDPFGGSDMGIQFPGANQMGGSNEMSNGPISQGDSPFNTPDVDPQVSGGGQPQTMDIGEDSAPVESQQQDAQAGSGGGLMDALNSIFRGR